MQIDKPRRSLAPLIAALCTAMPLLAPHAQEPAPATAPATAPAAPADAGAPVLSPEAVVALVKTAQTSVEKFFDSLPFIPIPELSTAPHSGVTVGLIPVVLSTNDKGEIDRILAPDLIYSQYFGWGARWRTFKNPSDDEKWSVVAGGKAHVEREFDAEYDLGLRRDRDWSWIAHAMFDRSGTGRFYGFGNETTRSAQTTFIESQMRGEMTAARNIDHELQIAYLVRANTVEVEQSALNAIPSIESRYPTLNGVGDATELHQRVVVSYDTRDAIVVPRSGERLAAFAGFTTRALGSSVDYSFFGFDGTWLHPFGPDLSLVWHVAARYMPGFGNAPFWAYSHLGGDSSTIGEAQPLRGYADGRWVDRNSFAASFEARTWVQSMHMFATDLKLEVAPFLDTGKVFSSMTASPVSSLHTAAGVGLRVIASPYVVGFLDFGYGREKFAVFSGIDYPF